MKLRISTEYVISKTNIHISTHDLIELTEYLKECDIYSEESLGNTILDYVWDFPSSEIVSSEDVEYTDEILNADVLNIQELIKHYSYLIKEDSLENSLEEELDCCDGQTGNYCSTCGKKLK